MTSTDFRSDRDKINNAFYDDLGERWFIAEDDPVALLRAEGNARRPWVEQVLAGREYKILDVGCGAGFLTSALAERGHQVTGVDASVATLEMARQRDPLGRIQYVQGDAYALDFADHSFDVVTAMDFLEHVSDPKRVLDEVRRVLKPGGLFFFHTFNRNWLAWLIVIKGVEWFVKNTPPDLHVLSLFIKPSELQFWLEERGFQVQELRGLRPALAQKAFWRMLFTGKVAANFRFVWTQNLWLGYSGVAQAANTARSHPSRV